MIAQRCEEEKDLDKISKGFDEIAEQSSFLSKTTETVIACGERVVYV